MFAALKAVGCILLIMNSYWMGLLSVIVSHGTQMAIGNHALRAQL